MTSCSDVHAWPWCGPRPSHGGHRLSPAQGVGMAMHCADGGLGLTMHASHRPPAAGGRLDHVGLRHVVDGRRVDDAANILQEDGRLGPSSWRHMPSRGRPHMQHCHRPPAGMHGLARHDLGQDAAVGMHVGRHHAHPHPTPGAAAAGRPPPPTVRHGVRASACTTTPAATSCPAWARITTCCPSQHRTHGWPRRLEQPP
jgi:hypothetical protein